MHQWLVGGGIVLGPEGLLLVRNRRRNGRYDWSPPGGVIDDGETLIGGLTREVREETGLAVSSWSGPVYVIEAVAPGLGWELRVEAHVATEYSGALRVDDPDGIVDDARFVGLDRCADHLTANHPWVREPLTEWLTEQWGESRQYRYRVDGSRLSELVVTRTATGV
ncbi:MAG: NUDIX hydrolase [Acidimicrobiales bacterium]|nr:NUDIX hydrolase [Acidimicrobiales bacterium]